MIHTAVQLLTGFLEAVAFYVVIDAVCEKRENVPSWIYYAGCFMVGVIIDLSFYNFFATITNTFVMYLAAVLFAMLFKGSVKIKILVPLICLTVNGCSEMIILYVQALVFDMTTYELVTDKRLWIAGALSSKVLFLTFANFVRIRYQNRQLFSHTSFWILFMIVFAPSLSTSFVMFRLLYNVSDMAVYNIALVTCIGLVISSFASMYLYEHISKQSEILNREQQYEQQIKSQKKHLDEILLMQKHLQSFRHDIMNHSIALKSYFLNNDCEGGIRYIDGLGALYDAGNIIFDTGNIALDAIISTKRSLAEENKIKFESIIQIPEKLPIDASDICIIFGNALDNAIEACNKMKSGEKRIHLSVIYENGTTICKLSNSIDTEKKITLKTTKRDKKNHGYGLENIRHSLSKYNHVMKTEQTENEFVLSFIIFRESERNAVI